MFTYFLYDVTTGFEEFKTEGSDLSSYDILVIDDTFATDVLERFVLKVQLQPAGPAAVPCLRARP